MIFKTNLRILMPVLLLTGFLLASCDETNDPGPGSDNQIPDAYNFENVYYGGQTARIELLDKLGSEIEKAEGGDQVSAQALEDIFENKGILSRTDKNIASKVYQPDTGVYYNHFTKIENNSGNPDNVMVGRFFYPNGVEPGELVVKGLMGALLYYQATSVYLGDDKMNVNNSEVVEGEGTAMEHHWDEAFGYFGAPKDYLTNDKTEVDGDYTGSSWFWADYAISRDDVLQLRDTIFKAFIAGRAAISNGDMQARDEARASIKKHWELLAAGNVVHYINSTISDIQNEATVSRYHHWSEAKGFLTALKYNQDKTISPEDLENIQNMLGDKPSDAGVDQLEQANQKLQSIFGFSDAQMLNL